MIGFMLERIARISGRPLFRRSQWKIRFIPHYFPVDGDISLLLGVKFQGIHLEFDAF